MLLFRAVQGCPLLTDCCLTSVLLLLLPLPLLAARHYSERHASRVKQHFSLPRSLHLYLPCLTLICGRHTDQAPTSLSPPTTPPHHTYLFLPPPPTHTAHTAQTHTSLRLVLTPICTAPFHLSHTALARRLVSALSIQQSLFWMPL